MMGSSTPNLPMQSDPASVTSSSPPALFLTLLTPDIRFNIYKLLLQQPQYFQIIQAGNNPIAKGHLTALSLTCQHTKIEIDEWYSHNTSWLSHLHQLGIYAPEHTSVVLEILHHPADDQISPCSSYESLQKAQHAQALASRAWTRFWKSGFARDVRHLVIPFRLPREPLGSLSWADLMPGLRRFEKLESVTFVFREQTGVDLGSVEAMMCLYLMWEGFWERIDCCHPGRCCTCCGQLPELRAYLQCANGAWFGDSLPWRFTAEFERAYGFRTPNWYRGK